LTFLRLGFHVADVEPGDGAGVFAGLDGEFFLAVQDEVAGVLMMTVTSLPAWRGSSFIPAGEQLYSQVRTGEDQLAPLAVPAGTYSHPSRHHAIADLGRGRCAA
jgi:hypothetical protein